MQNVAIVPWEIQKSLFSTVLI